jgi:hypothetical protein
MHIPLPQVIVDFGLELYNSVLVRGGIMYAIYALHNRSEDEHPGLNHQHCKAVHGITGR